MELEKMGFSFLLPQHFSSGILECPLLCSLFIKCLYCLFAVTLISFLLSLLSTYRHGYYFLWISYIFATFTHSMLQSFTFCINKWLSIIIIYYYILFCHCQMSCTTIIHFCHYHLLFIMSSSLLISLIRHHFILCFVFTLSKLKVSLLPIYFYFLKSLHSTFTMAKQMKSQLETNDVSVRLYHWFINLSWLINSVFSSYIPNYLLLYFLLGLI